MSPAIPRQTIEDILDRASIVDTVSAYIPLKRAGRNLRALCPFHQEKTPSFVVSPDKQIYHCFGCGAGGNSLGFLMQYERMGFVEAAQTLAKRVGVEIKASCGRDNAETKTRFYDVNEAASFFYHRNLCNPQISGRAKEYFKKRGVTDSLIKDMRLGFATAEWDGLLRYLREKKANPALSDRLGLVVGKDRGRFYDRFRNRLIFPVFDVRSNVIAFGARVLDDSLPKYINSPETPLYIKGRNLYGLNFSKESIRQNDFCIVVEGYLDFILPYSLGVKNIVASLGTALTTWQISLIKRYTNNVLMVYDSDPAGEAATLRSLDLLVEEGMSVRVVSLGEGLDPDSFVRRFGVDSFRSKIGSARNLFDYKLDFLLRRYDRRDTEQKARIIDEMLQTINKFDNNLIRSEYITRISQEFSLPENVLFSEAERIKQKRNFDKGNRLSQDRFSSLRDDAPAFERLLVSLMLREQSLIVKVGELISGDEFRDRQLGHIAKTILNLNQDGLRITPDKLGSYFSDPQTYALVCKLSAMDEPVVDKDRAVKECILRLKKEAIKSEKGRVFREIKDAQKKNDEEGLNRLLEEFNRLSKEEKMYSGKVRL
ncbi:MAG: DNA primase [Candidatus Omnitrophota bacterium]